MRFSDRIKLIAYSDKKYNPLTGEYDVIEPSEKILPCHVSNLSLDRVQTVFGDIEKEIISVRLRTPSVHEFDHAYIKLSHEDDFNESIKYVKKGSSNYQKGVIFLEGFNNE